MKQPRLLHAGIAVLLLGASGCSDDDLLPDAGTPDAGTPDLPLAGDSGGDQPSAWDHGTDQAVDQAVDQAPLDGPAVASLTVTVKSMEGDHWDPHGSHPGWWVADTTTTKPLAGATVAADLPGGKRVELTSPASGVVTFTGVDWKLGTAAVTGFAKGHVMRSLMGITKADGGLTLYLLKHRAQPATIVVTGTASGMDAQKNYLGVGGT